jgi:hypothetical protein
MDWGREFLETFLKTNDYTCSISGHSSFFFVLFVSFCSKNDFLEPPLVLVGKWHDVFPALVALVKACASRRVWGGFVARFARRAAGTPPLRGGKPAVSR